MSAELQAAINKTFGVRISTLEFMRSPNLEYLADILMDKTILSLSSPVPEVNIQENSVIDHMSEKDIDILLKQLLMEVSGASLGASKGAAV